MVSTNPYLADWIFNIGDGNGTWPIDDGHLVVVSRPGLIQARCTCGWSGPNRTNDSHAVALVRDDTQWHCHHSYGICPEWERCATCNPTEVP